MTRQQHLLIRAMEECAEVTQSLSKALIFGLEDSRNGQDNRARILEEFTDLVAVLDLAGFPLSAIDPAAINRKFTRVETYMQVSEARGTLDAPPQRLTCLTCGKPVSSEFIPLPTDTPDRGLVVRAYVECPECIENTHRIKELGNDVQT